MEGRVFEHFETTRGQRAIVVDGYKFRIERQQQKTKQWKCVITDCKARCFTDLDMTKVLSGQLAHNHVTDNDVAAIMKTNDVKERCKKRALLEPDEKPATIFIKVKEQGTVSNLLPKDYVNIRQAIYRHRAKLQEKLPANRSEVRYFHLEQI